MKRGWKRPSDSRAPRAPACHALEDAGNYITKVPEAIHSAEWQAATEALILVAALGGPTMFARIAVMRALNRNVEQTFDSTRKDHHWGAPETEERYLMKLTHKFEEMTPEKRPQDPNMNGSGLTFEPMEHGGEYPDTMPQAIKVTDAEGRSCIYVPITQDDKVVDSYGYSFDPEDVI